MPKPPTNTERDHGGMRLPSEEALVHHLKLTASSRTQKALLIRSARGVRIKIYERDLKHLRKIGDGQWRTGYYRALALARELWLDRRQIESLKRHSPDGTVKGAILEYIESKENENENNQG